MASTWTTKTAAEAVQTFLDERVPMGSAGEGVQAVVRLAYRHTYLHANGEQFADVAKAYQVAAQTATAGRITADDLVHAVQFNMGL